MGEQVVPDNDNLVVVVDEAATDGFAGYLVATKGTPAFFLATVGALVALLLAYVVFFVFCLPSWKNLKSSQEARNLIDGADDNDDRGERPDNEVPSDGTGPMSDSDNRQVAPSSSSTLSGRQSQQSQQQQQRRRRESNPEEVVSLLRPDSQPNLIRRANHNHNNHHGNSNSSRAASSAVGGRMPVQDSGLQAPATNDRASAVPSTTSSARVRRAASSDRPLRSWDLGSSSMMGSWRHRGSLRRVQSIQRMVQAERQQQVQQQLSSEDGGSNASRSRSSWNSRPGGGGRSQSHRGMMSDVASSILDEGNVEGEAQFYRQRYIDRNRSRSRRRGPNSSASSIRSLMPPLSPDAISPDEAADAHDPGTLNVGFADENFADDEYGDCLNCCSPVGNILDYSDLDFETRRILTLAFPSTIEAGTDPFFRMGVVALLSHFLDTDSMVAFLLVSLIVRTTTDDLSGAVADAQSTLLQEAIAQGGNLGFTLAGRFIQLGVLMQFIFIVPILLLWIVLVQDFVGWLVPENDDIAQLALEYTHVIVIEFAIRAAIRSFMLVFHLTGQAQFELNVDLSTTALTIAIIAIASSVSDNISLKNIGWIQVAIALVTASGKVAYISWKGLLKPYQQGLFGGLTLLDAEKVKLYLLVAFPLVLGALVEIGEWEILTLFVQKLGGAEVVTWAMMGIVWEVFEAFTEGLGEASAVRVSYYLSENLPQLAEQIANKSVFLSIIESTILTAIFLMIGPNLSVALTRDAALQNLFNDVVPVVALANVAMSLAQIYWSLLGAQGYFSKASLVILLDRWLFIIPMGCVLVYAANYDILAVAGVLAAGYAIGGTILARSVIHSDWNAVAGEAVEDYQDADAGLGLESDDEIEEEDEEESEDSSTGFG